MKKKIYTRRFVLTLCTLTGLVAGLHAQVNPESSNKLKKGVNWALNITDRHTTPPRTYLNIGFISNYASLSGVGINAISYVNHNNANGLQISGLVNITGENAAGMQLAGIANVNGRNSAGLLVGGLTNISGKNLAGLSVSGLANISGHNATGVIIGGAMNVTGHNTAGITLSGLANISGKDMKGIMIGGLMNVSGQTLYGLQISSLLNAAGRSNSGVQLAALGNLAVDNRGLQLALANYAADNRGVQIGVSNIATRSHKNLQFGLINISADSCARQIGCVNITPLTKVQFIVSGGNLNMANIAVRFKKKYTYTELGVGSLSPDNDKRFDLSAFYRAGACLNINTRWSINTDMAFLHTEALKDRANTCNKHKYTLQPRIGLEYHITPKLGIIAMGGYAWTNSYKTGLIERNPSAEIGIVLF